MTPLGTPALAGAASITAVILETHQEPGIPDDTAIALIILPNSVTVWTVLACAPAVGRFLGRNGPLVLHRSFGIVIVAIGVEITKAGFASHWTKLAQGRRRLRAVNFTMLAVKSASATIH